LIAARRAGEGIPFAVSCRALGVSRSWFYKWKNGTLAPRARCVADESRAWPRPVPLRELA